MLWGRKDAFPGADGSTIQDNGDATTIQIYGADGSTLTESTTNGLQIIEITTEGILDENNSQIYSIKHPLTFIYNSASPYDWYTRDEDSQNNTLWEDGGQKSVFDPCPRGWTVPAIGTWSDFSLIIFLASTSGTNVSNGRTYNEAAWFSAGGYRGYTSGALYYIGINGATWSSSIKAINAMALGFTMSGVGPSNTYNRARGFSIRCVQE